MRGTPPTNLNKYKTAYWSISYIRCQAQYGKNMRTENLIEQEIRRIAKEIKETCRNDGDADWEDLLRKAVRKHELTSEERDKLRDSIRY